MRNDIFLFYNECKGCGKILLTDLHNNNFCSDVCKKEVRKIEARARRAGTFNKLDPIKPPVKPRDSFNPGKAQNFNKIKTCLICNSTFSLEYPCQKTCSKECSKKLEANRKKAKGKGGKPGNRLPKAKHTDSLSYKTGEGSYRRHYFDNNLNRVCESCKVTIDFTKNNSWVIHHKDHNHSNHDLSNLQLLCKRCHQIDHKCWNAFNKV